MENPFDDPAFAARVEAQVKAFVDSCAGQEWDAYLYGQAAQDMWDVPLQKLTVEDFGDLAAHMVLTGEFPSPEVAACFSRHERRVFGRCVEDEL